MNMKSLKTQFIGAIAMVLVAAIAMGSSTYAWFSLNNKVDATGMQVSTSVSNNLLISGSTLAATSKNADSTFGTIYEADLKGILEPTSTVNGVNYFYTKDAAADGHKLTATSTTPYIAYDASAVATNTTDFGNAFSEYYAITKTAANTATSSAKDVAEGYIDYVFQLKAVATEASQIRLTGLNLVYGEDPDAGKAFRVAVLVENENTSGSGTAFSATPGTLRQIYSESGASLFGSTAVTSTTDKAAINNPTGTNALVANITTANTYYYKVVVRLWLEGEDTTCNNSTYMTLTDNWSLALEMKLVPTANDTDNAVSVITKTTTTTP